MRSINLLICIIILCAWSGGLGADDTRYRVEVLVLTELEHSEPGLEVPWPRNYAAALDFLTPQELDADEAEEADTSATAEAAAPGPVTALPPETADAGVEIGGEPAGPDAAAGGEDTDAAAEAPPPLAVPVEEMSPVMQEAWRRLRLSKPFRPEQYLSWEQGGEAPFPVLRVHDADVVLVDDPWADLRTAAESGTDPAMASPLAAPEAAIDPEGPAAEPGAGDEEGESAELALPDPVVYYRLDGTARLRRSRFLHMDLDVSLRQPDYGAAVPAPEPAPADGPAAGAAAPPRPPSFLVYRLEQSRQVQTDHMEYFDSPVLGILVYVTELEPEDEAYELENPR